MQKILIVDIETTGFLNQEGKIVEIGLVELCLKTGDKKIIFNKIINPALPVEYLKNTWIVKNGFMNATEIVQGVSFPSIKLELQELIDRYPRGITAFNRKFDIEFLMSYGIRFNKLLPCPMEKSTPIVQAPPTPKMRAYRPSIKYKTPNCEEAYKHFFPESNYVEKHRGADDAWHEADIVLALHKLNAFL